MMHSKAFYKKIKTTGPGGMKCSCCFPAPGSLRKKEFHISKVRERKMFTKLIQLELMEVS